MIYPELAEWLDSDTSMPCILFELQGLDDGVEKTFYFSQGSGYVTEASETPASTVYLPLASGGMASETIAHSGGVSISYGNIVLDNTDGSLDHLLKVIFENRQFSVYLGDVTWPRSSFKLVRRGYIDSVNANAKSIALSVRDNLQVLNYPVSETTVGVDDAALIPVALGDCSNVPALLIEPSQLRYKVNRGAVKQIWEVRDSGAPVSFTEFANAGEFTLSQSPVGTITASVQGSSHPAYKDTAPGIILSLLRGGFSGRAIPEPEIDTSAFQEYELLYPYCVGAYLTSRENILSLINKLASSIFCSVYTNSIGKVTITKLAPADGSPDMEVSSKNILHGSFSISRISPPEHSIKLAYNLNNEPQSSLATGIPVAHQKEWAETWKYRVLSREGAEPYKSTTEPEPVETLLQRSDDLWYLMNDYLDLHSVKRFFYRCTLVGSAALVELNDKVWLKYPRYGLESGVMARVTKIQPDYINKTSNVEFMV
jgi:hypothetical protein